MRQSLSKARLEHALLAFLLLGLGAYWLSLPNPFVLPNNDYYSFERAARSFGQLELPDSFKRMPILPALMALVAPLIPTQHAHLAAARMLNLAFSAGMLVLFFDIAARTMRRGALIPVLILALNPVFHSMALQPLVEPSLGFFVLLGFSLFLRRSRWQYAAAAAAALSRYEIGLIIPVLVLANVWRDKDWRGHLGRGALSLAPVLVWTLLGMRFGESSGNYLELMSATGFAPEPRFLHSSLKQPFEGWYRGLDDQLHWFLLAVGLPIAAGLRAGWRDHRNATQALTLFYLLSVLAVMAFGIDKGRYVQASQWIAILFFAWGAVELTFRAIPDWLERRPSLFAWLLGLAALAMGLRMASIWIGKLAAERSDLAIGIDLSFAAFAVFLLAIVALAGTRKRALAGAASAMLLLAVVTPLLIGGLRLSRYELNKVRHYNWDMWLLGDWIDRELPEDSRVVVMHASHIKFLTDLDEDSVLNFADFDAQPEDFVAFVDEMRARGFDHAAYTYRAPPKDPTTDYYYRNNKIALAERFAAGEAVEGFERIASLPLPEWLEHSNVQIYRLRAP